MVAADRHASRQRGAGRAADLGRSLTVRFQASASRLGSIRLPKIEVVPGVTSIQALCAAHALPLNDIGEPFLVTTGRRLREDGFPSGVDTVVVMLDGGAAFQSLDPTGVRIFWGAYLGMADQIIMAGALADVGAQIVEMRRQARERHGWIMDSYILKRASVE